mmetsp:Transcript_29142/g.60828  ORF Transcript_29142/g.60828 Transcript_29142/m.60828 type:complete len:88 (+) Transcript_29142:752-1015(+)
MQFTHNLGEEHLIQNDEDTQGNESPHARRSRHKKKRKNETYHMDSRMLQENLDEEVQIHNIRVNLPSTRGTAHFCKIQYGILLMEGA